MTQPLPHQLYSMTAFKEAVHVLLPYTYMADDVSYKKFTNEELINEVAIYAFTIDEDGLPEIKQRALDAVRKVATLRKDHGHFIFGSKPFKEEWE